jgi:hypothetical protein
MIHAHENDSTGFYTDMDAAYPQGFFIHMPLDYGEFVTEICRRYALAAGNRISACLVVRYLSIAFWCVIVFVTNIAAVVHYEQRWKHPPSLEQAAHRNLASCSIRF